MSGRTDGRTSTGKPIDDEMIEGLADEAERDYEPGYLDEHRRGPGRPPLGDAAKVVESVRLDPGLRVETAERATAEGVTVSEIIRRALRQYLRSAEARDAEGSKRIESGRSGVVDDHESPTLELGHPRRRPAQARTPRWTRTSASSGSASGP